MLTLMDDGRLPGGVASAPFDGEGTRTQRTSVVERGVVRETPKDLQSGGGARGSTGNGVRASFREPPSLRTTNFFVRPGAAPAEEIVSSVRQGIHISALGRLPNLTSVSSPFTVPFSGRWIDAGSQGSPLAGGYLASNLRELLSEVETVGADLCFSHRGGSFGAPTLHLRRAPVRSS
jgi:PmbA protein